MMVLNLGKKVIGESGSPNRRNNNSVKLLPGLSVKKLDLSPDSDRSSALELTASLKH